MPKRPRPDKSQIKVEAEQAFKKSEQKFKSKNASDNELKLLNDLQRKGTLSDKVSALMMKVQKSYIPDKFCDFASIEALMHIAKKKSRHHSQASIEGLKELFVDTLLPNRPLQYINDTEMVKVPGGLSRLHFEDKLKHKYTEFINILKSHSLDTIDFSKKSAISVLGSLLIKSEMQDYIIECIVNKLGDPSTCIPTHVVLECNHLVWKNKLLLEPVLKAISRFLTRPALSSSAKFYSIVFLNSLKLHTADQVAIQLLIQTLLRLFPIVVQETRTSGNRAVSLLLKALNKNFPLFTNKSAYHDFFTEEINEIYRLAHLNNTSIQIEALRFIFQSEQAQGFVSDRYYRALYEFILPVPCMRSITYKSQAMLFNTLMISLKEDTNISRVKAFAKRILQICLISEPPFILASLILISEMIKIHKSINQMLEVPSDDEEEVYEDMPDSDQEEIKQESYSKSKTSKKSKEKPKEKAKAVEKKGKISGYDALKREPRFSAAESSALYELGILAMHPHPSVAKWARLLMGQESIEYEGDPLLDFTLVNFLDRFEYRNPKKSLINKLKGKKVRMSLVEDAVNTKEFRDKEGSSVREEELFFHKYFKLRPERVKEEEEEEGSEAEEEEFGDEFREFGNEEGEDEEGDDQLDFGGNTEEQEDDGALPKKKAKKGIFMDADEFYYNNNS